MSANSFQGTAQQPVDPFSPELNPVQFYLWGHLHDLVHSVSIKNESTFHQGIFNACQIIRNRPGAFKRKQQPITRCLNACINWGGGSFEHLLLNCSLVDNRNSTVIKLGTCTVNVLCQL
jgi:hypothetical protein